MIIKPQCVNRITTMGQQPTDTTEPMTLYMRCMFHCLVTAPRLLDVGGIICSVGDDDSVGLLVRGVHPFRGLHIRSTHGCNPITAPRF